MKLYRPTKPFFIGQGFGESLACIQSIDDVPMTQLEVVTKVNGVCPTGFRELYPLLGLKGHNGLDCLAPTGTPLYACADGTVEDIATEPERGIGLDIVTNELSDLGNNLKYRYWHLQKLNVVIGQHVNVGDLVGWADSTGFSSASHLHWEVKPVRKNAKGEWYNVYQNNGYYGAIDFRFLLSDEYAVDFKAKLILIAESLKVATKAVEEVTKISTTTPQSLSFFSLIGNFLKTLLNLLK